MINEKDEHTARVVEGQLDILLDFIEITKEMAGIKTDADYRLYLRGQSAAFFSVFKHIELGIADANYKRIEAKLDELYDFAHGKPFPTDKPEPFDPFNL